MQFLEILWQIYLHGWTFEHWHITAFWTVPLTIAPFGYAAIAYWHWQDGAAIRRINRR